MTGRHPSGDPADDARHQPDAPARPADRLPDPWADQQDRPGVFFRIRDGRPQFGPGCAIFAIVGSIAAIVVLVLVLRMIGSVLGDVRIR